MSIVGDWDVTIKTPIGSLAIVYSFTDEGGVIGGQRDGPGRDVPLRDIAVANDPGGQRITWRQSVTKPIRLNLSFDVVVDGDRLAGHSRAGRLPRSAVAGVRRR